VIRLAQRAPPPGPPLERPKNEPHYLLHYDNEPFERRGWGDRGSVDLPTRNFDCHFHEISKVLETIPILIEDEMTATLKARTRTY